MPKQLGQALHYSVLVVSRNGLQWDVISGMASIKLEPKLNDYKLIWQGRSWDRVLQLLTRKWSLIQCSQLRTSKHYLTLSIFVSVSQPCITCTSMSFVVFITWPRLVGYDLLLWPRMSNSLTEVLDKFWKKEELQLNVYLTNFHEENKLRWTRIGDIHVLTK